MVEQLSAGFKIRKQLHCNLTSCMQYLLLGVHVRAHARAHAHLCVCGYVGVCAHAHMRICVHVLLLWRLSSSMVVFLRIQLFWDNYKWYCNLLCVC